MTAARPSQLQMLVLERESREAVQQILCWPRLVLEVAQAWTQLVRA